jgi:hypothetical protein
MRRLGPWACAVLVIALAVPILLAARDAPAGAVALSAEPARPLVGQRAIVRARLGGDAPDDARIVIAALRLGPRGAVVARSFRACRLGARACVVRAGAPAPRRVRYRALLRLDGRTLAASRPLVVAWRAAGGPVAPVGAPGGPGSPATPAPPAPGAPRPLPGLPDFTAGFEGWTRLNALPIPPDSPAAQRVGTDAHRGTKDVYVNVPREVALSRPFPAGTVVVKVARRSGTPGYALVATMRKIAGADPAHGDWRFVEYLADGRGGFATRAGLSDGGCWGCHGIAADTDWVFTATD